MPKPALTGKLVDNMVHKILLASLSTFILPFREVVSSDFPSKFCRLALLFILMPF